MLSICCNSRIKSSENWKKTERVRKNEPFVSTYNWKGTNIPWGKDGWETSDKNTSTIAINVLYIKKWIPPIFQNTT